jgi:hypothetical protein
MNRLRPRKWIGKQRRRFAICRARTPQDSRGIEQVRAPSAVMSLVFPWSSRCQVPPPSAFRGPSAPTRPLRASYSSCSAFVCVQAGYVCIHARVRNRGLGLRKTGPGPESNDRFEEEAADAGEAFPAGRKRITPARAAQHVRARTAEPARSTSCRSRPPQWSRTSSRSPRRARERAQSNASAPDIGRLLSEWRERNRDGVVHGHAATSTASGAS